MKAMDKSKLIELIHREKERCERNYLHYGQLIHKTLPIVFTLIIGMFVVGIEKEIYLLITFFPLILVSTCALMQSIFLSAFAADCGIRLYEKKLNSLTNCNLYFLHKELHSVFHSHETKSGWSPKSFILYAITFGVFVLLYLYSISVGEEWLRQNFGKGFSFLYLIITIFIPIFIFDVFSKLKKEIDIKMLKISEDLLSN